MTRLKRINRIILAWVGGSVVILGFAVAGLLGLALVVIHGALGILAMESERAMRRLGNAKDFLLRTHRLTK